MAHLALSMSPTTIRVLTVAISISLAGAGAVIYSKGNASGDAVVEQKTVAPETPSVNDPGAFEAKAATEVAQSADVNAPVAIPAVDAKAVQKKIEKPSKFAPAEEASKFDEIPDIAVKIDRLSVDIDAFLKTRYEARDDNPLPELVVWLEQRAEIEKVSVTESIGEVLITFKGGGATVMQIGQ